MRASYGEIKIETILKRIQVYNSEAKVICIESDTIALVNFNGEFIDSAPQIKDEYIVSIVQSHFTMLIKL